jgi:hypothetical protein
MAVLNAVKELLTQYAAGAVPAGDAGTHFQQVAQSVDSRTLAHGIATAMRSDQTPPFSQIISQLFASGSSDQRTAMLNTLLSAVPPEQRAQISKLIPGFGAALAGAQSQAGANISPGGIQQLAQHVEQHDAGIVDKMSALYAQHPTLVRTLGSAAMMIAMRAIAQRHQGE